MGSSSQEELWLKLRQATQGWRFALVAGQKGYRLILVIPDKFSQEKILHLKALGAEVISTRSDVHKGHPDYYTDRAQQIAAQTPGAYFVNQFENSANPAAHERTTAPEIWAQMEHQIDAIVCGVGSGGTLTGLGRYFSRNAPQLSMILADPEGVHTCAFGARRSDGEARKLVW